LQLSKKSTWQRLLNVDISSLCRKIFSNIAKIKQKMVIIYISKVNKEDLGKFLKNHFRINQKQGSIQSLKNTLKV